MLNLVLLVLYCFQQTDRQKDRHKILPWHSESNFKSMWTNKSFALFSEKQLSNSNYHAKYCKIILKI